ncbi:galactosylceramide sulfotransferase-like [Lingula anatina]|uniref:Galactosylceramide sulfotransferase-like n=1 Tax=Lingula anatina TaxID=7574 RepID=A0A2R2MIX4_LINAN|nr:galactosylceramide sulfotransferase-like [Lingula anatina]|eukprot:XP_023930158.1 galactosylceramide sulfotransferase-like [Lingula anatina]
MNYHDDVIGVNRNIQDPLFQSVYNVPPIKCLPEGQCQPTRHIMFLKVHKCGSTTMAKILKLATLKYKLKPLSPKKKVFFYPWKSKFDINRRKITINDANYNPNVTYDIIFNHMIFDSRVIETMMPNDTFYIGIVREPFSQFQSAFNFYRISSKFNLKNSTNPVVEFMKNPYRYWTDDYVTTHVGFLRNAMMYAFGFPDDRNDLRNNDRFIAEYIDFLDKKFDFVIVLEMLDESLVLLRRLLCWGMDDVLYVVTNKREYEYKNVKDEIAVKKHRLWSKADYQLYSHFLTKLRNTVMLQGSDFNREVSLYRQAISALGKLLSVVSLWNEALNWAVDNLANYEIMVLAGNANEPRRYVSPASAAQAGSVAASQIGDLLKLRRGNISMGTG